MRVQQGGVQRRQAADGVEAARFAGGQHRAEHVELQGCTVGGDEREPHTTGAPNGLMRPILANRLVLVCVRHGTRHTDGGGREEKLFTQERRSERGAVEFMRICVMRNWGGGGGRGRGRTGPNDG